MMGGRRGSLPAELVRRDCSFLMDIYKQHRRVKHDSEYSQYLFMITGYINLFQRSFLVGVKYVKIINLFVKMPRPSFRTQD